MKKFIVSTLAILLISIIDYAQSNPKVSEFEKDFNVVASVYEKNVKPYLLEFSKKQYKTDADKEGFNDLIDSRYRIYWQQAENLRKESFIELQKSNAKDKMELSKSFLIEYFDFDYRHRFPGLDYAFFDKCKDELF